MQNPKQADGRTDSSRLLIDESPLQVLPALALAVGLNEAIVLQQLHYWSRHSSNIHDGHRWVYNTIGEWRQQFPFWSATTIKRIMASLREKGLIVVEQGVARSMDRTNWYRLDYSALPQLDDAPAQAGPIVGSDGTAPSGQDGPVSKRTETTQKTTTESRSHSEPIGFEEWLTHHCDVTGQQVPGRETQARAKLAAKYATLTGEGRSLDDMKLASIGAHADEWLRENGKVFPRNVLVSERIDELIEKGRRASPTNGSGPKRFERQGPRREI